MNSNTATASNLTAMDETALVQHFQETIPTTVSDITDDHLATINELCARLPQMSNFDAHFIIYNGNYGLTFGGRCYQFPADRLTNRALRGIINRYYSDLMSNRHLGTC